jgi:hypothetical protein
MFPNAVIIGLVDDGPTKDWRSDFGIFDLAGSSAGKIYVAD